MNKTLYIQHELWNRKNMGLYIVLGASFLLSLLYIPYFDYPLADKEVYRYLGTVILKGGVPYRDAFDHKPPLIFFLNYAALLLGGDWGQWLIDTALAMVASGMFFRLCKKHGLPLPWLLPVLFNLMLRDFVISLGMGMTREYTAVLTLIFFCVMLGNHRFRDFWLGLLCGLIFFMQQDQVVALFPFFIYLFLSDKTLVSFASRILRLAAGFMSVALPIILYFAWHNALRDFWQDAFLFNLTWYTTTLKESLGGHLRKIKLVIDEGNYREPFMITVTLAVFALIRPGTNKKLVIASVLAIPLSVIPEFLGGRDVVDNSQMLTFTHYVLLLAATLPICLFCILAFTREPVFRNPLLIGIFSILLCTGLVYMALRKATVARQHKMESAEFSVPQIRYLRQHRPGDYQLFSFGGTSYTSAYSDFNILAPSKWDYQHFYFLYDNWDSNHAIMRSIEHDLLQHKTTYVLNYALYNDFRDPVAYNMWHSFLEEHYERVVLPRDERDTVITLWKWKGTPDQAASPEKPSGF